MQFALLCLLYVEHKMFVNSRSHKKGKSETRLPEIGGDGGIRLHSVFPCGGRENRIQVSTSVCTGRCKPPMWLADMIRIPLVLLRTKKGQAFSLSFFLVETEGFEPLTLRMRTVRSPS